MFRLLSTCRLILWTRLWNRNWYWSRGPPRKPKFWSWRANLLKQITCFLSCKNQNCGANLVYKVVISEPLNFPTGYLTWVLSNIDNTNFYMTHTMLQFVYLSIFVIYLDLYIGLALRIRLVYVFKNWKLLFENICKNTCGWKVHWNAWNIV